MVELVDGLLFFFGLFVYEIYSLVPSNQNPVYCIENIQSSWLLRLSPGKGHHIFDDHKLHTAIEAPTLLTSS
jgi:hypothetical protein